MGVLSVKSGPPVIIDSSDKLAALLGGSASGSGVTVNATNAMRYSAFASCVRVIGESVGMLPLFLYRKKGRSREKDSSHSLYSILNVAPNSYMTAREFWTMAGVHLAARGRFYAWKNVVRGELRELLPLHPDSVTPKLREDWTLVYQVNFPNGRVAVLDQDEIFHVRVFSMDGINGLDPISYMRESLGEGIAGVAQGGSSFRNGSRLSGVLSTDGTLKDDAYERIRKSWNETYSGAENAFKVAILEAGLKFAPVSMTNEQAQFVASRKLTRSEMAGQFRMPPHKIGDLEHATFSNIEHQAQEFITDCLMPYLTAIEARVQVSLVPKNQQGDRFAKFNVNALLRGDMASRAAYWHTLIQDGAISPNEIREFEDWNPREGGDIYLTPMNMLIDGKPPPKPGNEPPKKPA